MKNDKVMLAIACVLSVLICIIISGGIVSIRRSAATVTVTERGVYTTSIIAGKKRYVAAKYVSENKTSEATTTTEIEFETEPTDTEPATTKPTTTKPIPTEEPSMTEEPTTEPAVSFIQGEMG